MIFGIAWFVIMWFGLVLVALVAAAMFVVRQKNDAGTDSRATSRQPQSNARQKVLEDDGSSP